MAASIAVSAELVQGTIKHLVDDGGFISYPEWKRRSDLVAAWRMLLGGLTKLS